MKQGRRLRAGETRIYTSNFDTEDCAVLLRKSLTGTTELVENHDRSQSVGYSRLNQYIYACPKLLKKQRDAGQSVISMEQIKPERVFMHMNMVQSRKVKYAKSTYKERIVSIITSYPLVGEIQGIEEALWDRNKTCEKFSLAGLRDRMCLLMTRCRIICCESFFVVNYQILGVLGKQMKSPIHYIVWLWKYSREKWILTGHYMEGSVVM